MKLRDHPLMSYHGVRNWPPSWVRADGETLAFAEGEIGVLREVLRSQVSPGDRVFLFIEHDGCEFLGCVLFSDRDFCEQVIRLLQSHCGFTVGDIGSLDLTGLPRARV
ncbi:MAG TPA: hypothetical protein VGA73_05730 [Candidatus Binatia bacterium]